jgi:hypothetical protein
MITIQDHAISLFHLMGSIVASVDHFLSGGIGCVHKTDQILEQVHFQQPCLWVAYILVADYLVILDLTTTGTASHHYWELTLESAGLVDGTNGDLGSES